MTVPTDAQLRRALAATEAVAVTAWNDTAANAALMEHVPEPAAIRARREIAELGVTVVRFANGVEAWLKPTDFKNDQVLFSLAGARRQRRWPPPEKYHRSPARDRAGRAVGRRRPQRRRSAEAAGGQDRVGLARSSRSRRKASAGRARRPISRRRCSSST